MTSTDRRVTRARNFRGVRLAPGRLLTQRDSVVDTFGALDPDSLLYPFRVRTGVDAPGTPLRGWYGEGLFNNLGQFMTLYARLFAATADPRFAEIARRLVRGWADTIDESGYFFSGFAVSSREYTFDKFVGGLLDIDDLVGEERALPSLRRAAQWMWRFGDRGRVFAWSGMGPLEWYTLSEYLYRAFARTGDELYLELANRYFYHEYFDLLLEGDTSRIFDRVDRDHAFYQAHSHVNALNGAAARYEVTGERRWLDAAIAGYDFVTTTQTYATGMLGPLETFVRPGHLGEILHSEVGHAEVSCPTWAIMRLVRHLIELTGEARFGDWVELALHNGVGALDPTRSDGRALGYFDDYGVGARKRWGLEWTCCSTTNPICIAEYSNQIYYTDADGVRVAQYVPSQLEASAGTTLALAQRGDPVVDGAVTVTVHRAERADTTLAFRDPAWTRGRSRVVVNGREVTADRADGWLRVRRRWRAGDRVEVILPSSLEAIPVPPADASAPVALRRGPVVLVHRRADDVPPVTRAGLEAVVAHHRPIPGRAGVESTAVNGTLTRLEPYADVPVGDNYDLYAFAPVRRVGFRDLEFDSPEHWRFVDRAEYLLPARRAYASSEEAGAWCQADVYGERVMWAGYRSTIAGYADVWIDDVLVERVTQMNRSQLQPFLWMRDGLPRGWHRVRIVVVGEAPSTSRGTEVNVRHLRGDS